MRYWGTESKVSRAGGRGRAKPKAKATAKPAKPAARKSGPSKPAPTSRSKVAAGGSVQPFLRRVYNHQAVMGGPLQRILLFLILAGVLYAFVLGDGGAIRIAILRHQRAGVDKDIAELRHNVALLEKEIGRLEKDAFYIEKIGRERYGYVKRDERVFKIVPEPKVK